jgi:hypothetical protein
MRFLIGPYKFQSPRWPSNSFFFYFFGPHIVKVREEKSLLPLVVFL